MDWYIVEEGEAAGPFKESEIRRWVRAGKLSTDTYAAREGLDEWRPIAEHFGEMESLPDLPPSSTSTISDEDSEAEGPVSSADKDPDLRRYQPSKEERIRMAAWSIVGLLYIISFFWPTHMADGMGIVNFELSWAQENLSWSIIPFMLWPLFAGLGLITLGILTRGRLRGFLGLILSILPVVLVLLIGGDGFSSVMGTINALPDFDFKDIDSAGKSVEQSANVLSDKYPMLLAGVIKIFASITAGMFIFVGVALSVYLTVLVAPHGVRYLRPNSKGAYYFAVLGGVVLFLFILVLFVLSLFSFVGGFLYGSGFVISIVMQLAAVFLGFTNLRKRSPKQSTRRALWSLGLSLGGVALLLFTLMIVPLIGGGLEAKIGMYLFKAALGFFAASLVLPLVTVDLWLGHASRISSKQLTS